MLSRGARLSDRVADALRAAILVQNLAPGTQLPTERELTEQFGVSRTVVREAIRILVTEGIVEVRSGSGHRVAAVDPATVSRSMSWFIRGGRFEYRDVHEIRDVIEVRVAGLAAERRDETDIRTLRESHFRFAQLIDNGDDSAALADVEFHNHIANATKNLLFPVLLDSIVDALIGIRRALLSSGIEADVIRQHRDILDAIVASDGAAAQAAMQAHLNEIRMAYTGSELLPETSAGQVSSQ
jgi:DNA-binding FadR family transcriptional regulator